MPPLRKIVQQYLAKRLFGYGPPEDFSYVDSLNGPAKDIKLLGLYSGVAYRCISTIAEFMGDNYSPYFYSQSTQGKKTTVTSHPLLTTLTNPNPDMSFYQLIEGSQTFIEQFGEFFWYMVGGQVTGLNGGVKQIYLLRPDRMGLSVDKDTGDVIGYVYNVGGGKKIPFQPEEIVHQMTFNPKNPYRGYSTVEAAVDYIKTEEEVSRFTRNYFTNNAAMSGVLSVNGKVPRENWNKFVRQWRERYQGVENAGKVALVRDSQIQFTPISSNIGEMQLDQLKQTTVEQILMMFRIPKGMFGMENDTGLGRASVETLEYIFAKHTMQNKMARIDDTIKRCLLRYYPESAMLCVDHENIIPADKVFELQVYNQGVDRWITRQEIRDKDPDLQNNDIEGADQLFVLNTQLPIDDAMTSEQAASKPPMLAPPAPPSDSDADDKDENSESEDDDKDSDDDDDDEDKGKSIKIIAKKKDQSPDTSDSNNSIKGNAEQFRLSLVDSASKYEHEYSTAFKTVLDAQEKRVVANLGHLGKSISVKDISDDLLNKANENQEIETAVGQILVTLSEEQGQKAIDFSGSNLKYQLTEALKNALSKSTQRMASNFNDQTMDLLSDELTAGIADGEGFDQLSQRVAEVYNQAKDFRTDRVARTETQNASNSATLDGYQQNPAVTAMEWFANPDCCDYCDALNGEQVGLEDSFVSQGDSVDVQQDDGSTDSYQCDYGDVDTPPLHPNCECTIIPVTE